MRRVAMYGMIGALSLTFGTIVIPSENFIRQNSKGVEESIIPTVSRELDTEDAKAAADTKTAENTEVPEDVSKVQGTAADTAVGTAATVDANANQAAACPHTDGNHTPDCPYYTGGYDCGHTDGNHPSDCPNWDGNCGHTDGNHPSDCPNWDGYCGHTDGNHPQDCPNWSGSQGNSGSGSSAGYSGHHGGGHHGGGHH